ncbi:MAG: SRPBCC domain-containing protein [Thermoplasmata archaeon]|nr:SRPBCC domain-containing protein [Thermoplasmata archaeon]
MPTRSLHQRILLKASPHQVYEALVDPKRHAAFTGSAVRAGRKPGTAFTHYDGSLSGFVVELVPDRRILLAWRASSWAKGEYSIARFELSKARGGTRLTFDQVGIPAKHLNGIADGWKQFYWTPLAAYLAS